MRIAPVALAVPTSAAIVLYASVSINAQPLCYMIDSSGQMRDLTAMCGKSSSVTSGTSDRTAPSKPTTVAPTKDFRVEVKGKRFTLKPMGDGRSVRLRFLDNGRDEFVVQTGSKDLRVSNAHTFSFSCPNEVDLIRVFSTSGGRTVENPVNAVDEMQRVAVERASKQAVGMACQGQNIPANGSY